MADVRFEPVPPFSEEKALAVLKALGARHEDTSMLGAECVICGAPGVYYVLIDGMSDGSTVCAGEGPCVPEAIATFGVFVEPEPYEPPPWAASGEGDHG